jgi:hypothetical protein
VQDDNFIQLEFYSALPTVSNPFISSITLPEIVSTILLFFAGVVTVPRSNRPSSITAADTEQANEQRKFFRQNLLSHDVDISTRMQDSIIVFVQPLKDCIKRLEPSWWQSTIIPQPKMFAKFRGRL